jgi:tripartite-type tricarboxylate transporter receptor subunit TctC
MRSFGNSFRIMTGAIALAGSLVTASMAVAQDYPTKAVTLVIPFAPGGSNDTYGRVLADGLGKLWKHTVIVENRPGAGSAIGSAHVSQAKPDGYTLLFVSTSYTTNAATLTKLPFDPAKDLQPVGMAAIGDLFIQTGSRLPLATIEALQKEGKAQKLFSATAGVGSISHLAGLLTNDNLGIKSDFVHFQGGAAAMTDLGGGRVDIFYTSMIEAVSGVGKPIAVMGERRSPVLPDVPTIAEAGFAQVQASLWWGVFAPAGTPKDVVTKLNADIYRVMGSPESAKLLEAQGIRASGMSVEDFSSYVKAELEKWTSLAEKHGLRK